MIHFVAAVAAVVDVGLGNGGLRGKRSRFCLFQCLGRQRPEYRGWLVYSNKQGDSR